jgi:hypothetical protein
LGNETADAALVTTTGDAVPCPGGALHLMSVADQRFTVQGLPPTDTEPCVAPNRSPKISSVLRPVVGPSRGETWVMAGLPQSGPLYPGLQVQVPFPDRPELHVPWPLHAFDTPPGHARQLGPYRFGSQTLQFAPVKPGTSHWQLPVDVQAPLPLQVAARVQNLHVG